MADELEVRRNTMTALDSYRASFGEVGAVQPVWDQFRGRIAELVATTPAFAGADVPSKLLICRRIAATNLWPGLGSDGEAYVVKYGAGANYTVGPRGWISLLYRAGAKSVIVECVHEGDGFDPGSVIPATAPTLKRSADPLRSAKPFTHAVAFVVWADGTQDWAIADTAYLERVKKASPAGDKGPWGKWPEQMAKAKALRLLAREVTRRVEMPQAARTALVHAVETDGDALEVESIVEAAAPDAAPQADTRPTVPDKKPRKTREKPVAAPDAMPASSPGQSASAEPSGDGEPQPPAQQEKPAEPTLEQRTAAAIAKEVKALGSEGREAWVNEFDDFPDEAELLAWFQRVGFEAAKKSARAFVDKRKTAGKGA